VGTAITTSARRGEDETLPSGTGELVLGTDESDDVKSILPEVSREIASDAEIVGRDDVLGYVTVAHSDISSPKEYDRYVRHFEGCDWCEYAEPNYLHYPMVTEARQVSSSHLNGDRGTGDVGNETGSLLDEQYAPRLVNAPDAWEHTMGSTDVTLGVIDTGVEHTHETLSSRFGDPVGVDYLSENSDRYVPAGSSHGTSVSGIAAATTDNETGIAGISNARLLAVRALGGAGSADTIARAIRWTADRADIINMSFATDEPSETIRRACAYAARQDTLLVAAAGNLSKQDRFGPDGSRGVAYPTGSRGVVYPTGSRGVVYPTGSRGMVYPTGSRGVVYPTGSRGVVYPTGSRGVVYPTDGDENTGAYPGRYDSVLSVSAIDRSEQPASFTASGDSIDLTAPGVDVLTTARGDNYASVSGTSMSSPVVAGAAALAKSLDPTLSAAELERLLTSTARPLGIDSDVEGEGCVDAAALLEALR
jgi:subtilisin family serine protease